MKRLRFLLRDTARDVEGSATVEFVIVMPVLLTALVFTFEFGRALFAYEVITSDVESAVRYISHVPSSQCSALSGNDITNAQNLAQCAALPTSGSPTTCTTPHFPWNSSSAATLSVTNAQSFSQFDSNGNVIFDTSGNVVQVKAAVPLSLTMLGYMGINTAYTLVVSDQARCMGN